MAFLSALLFALLQLQSLQSFAQVSQYQPCPILGPYLPQPQIDAGSIAVKSAFEDFTSFLEGYIANGTGRYGPIAPNTMSFSLAVFAGSNFVEDEDHPNPFVYEYHHTASELSMNASDYPGQNASADSVYAIGDLTQLVTMFEFLINEGDGNLLQTIVEYIPELEISYDSSNNAIRQVNWNEVTVGDLAGYLAGVVRTSGACQIDAPCDQQQFLRALSTKPPLELPGTTPIYSLAAYQLLAVALERKYHENIATLIDDDIVSTLSMKSTEFLRSSTQVFGAGLSNESASGEPASLGLVSSIADLSKLGRAILTSKLLDLSQTRRWLSPIADTSNLRNGVGRPWEIYHYGDSSIDPITDVYTKSGSVGRYSSYFGLVPALDVGFVILAVDTEREAPDLNAIADITIGALLEIQDLGRLQANELYTGTYEAACNDSKLSLELTGSDPGFHVSELTLNRTDWLASIANKAGIQKTSYLDLRLYPTNLEDSTDGVAQRAFQGVIQDKSALVDAGTPTCISWMTIAEFVINEEPLDRFVIGYSDNGTPVAIDWPALGVTYKRAS